MKKEVWFRAKTIGWGWCPYSWQGWLIIIFYILAISLSIISIDLLPLDIGFKTFIILVEIIFFTTILIYISYKKGEKPSWKWGF